MFWALAIALTGCMIFVLMRPLLRPTSAPDSKDRTAHALQLALAEIETDRTAGLIDDAAADEAVVETKRAALASATPATDDKPSRKLRFTAIVFLASSPIVVGLIYLSVGAPEALSPNDISAEAPLSQEEAVAAMAPDERDAAIRSMVDGLAARLENDPQDVDGWRMLARSYGVLGRHEESAAAYQQIFNRDAGTREDFRAAALMLIRVFGEEGDEEGALISVLETTLERFPGEPMALYQLGVAKRAAGKSADAAVLWRELLAIMPEDAPVRTNLEGLIAETEAEIAPDG